MCTTASEPKICNIGATDLPSQIPLSGTCGFLACHPASKRASLTIIKRIRERIRTSIGWIGKRNGNSIGKIKVLDKNKNKYFFKEIYVDTKKKEMIGSDISIILNQENFGLTNKNDPRFVANDILLTKNKIDLSKGVFTVCKLREDKCPPWSLKAKKISHDKIKKTIYYDSATLKIYDIPIFYFPKFFHPDPSVKRQSGFLSPFFTNSTNTGTGGAMPYYWAISKNNDLTFTPKIYTKEKALFLAEYRHAFKNSFLTLDTSYNEGYSDTSNTKTSGSRNHIFANFNINFETKNNSNSSLFVKAQQTSNDTYFIISAIIEVFFFKFLFSISFLKSIKLLIFLIFLNISLSEFFFL